MTETQHTPGPWYVLESPESAAKIAVGRSKNTGCIAVIYSESNLSLNLMANARLIAAAPEMLEEIKAIRHQVPAGTEHFNRLQRLMESIEQPSRDRDNA